MRLRGLFSLILTLLIVGGAVSQEPASSSGPMIGTESAVKPYLLGPGDEITGRVLGENQFDFTASVNEDGNILVPFFDKPIVAICRTEKALRADLVLLLEKQLRNPQFSLNTKRNSRPPATLYGEVKTPYRYGLTRRTTLIELLAESGGPTEEAGGVIEIKRTQPPMCADNVEMSEWAKATADADGVPTRILSLAKITSGEEDVIIYPGDMIHFKKAPPVYIVGEVANPMGLYLREEGMTLTEAIAMLGGLRREAKTKDIKIYRRKTADSKERDVLTANLDKIKTDREKDVMLQPYDIIDIDRAKDSVIKQIAQIALGASKTIVSSGASGLGYRVIR